jgi:hypothetical protein
MFPTALLQFWPAAAEALINQAGPDFTGQIINFPEVGGYSLGYLVLAHLSSNSAGAQVVASPEGIFLRSGPLADQKKEYQPTAVKLQEPEKANPAKKVRPIPQVPL